jgi:hypothetical protein
MMEAAKFNGKRNADTLSALSIGVIMLKENAYQESIETESNPQDDYYSRELYPDSMETDDIVVSLG